MDLDPLTFRLFYPMMVYSNLQEYFSCQLVTQKQVNLSIELH